MVSVCPALNMISSIFFTTLCSFTEYCWFSVYHTKIYYHFFHEAHFADTACSYEYICHSDSETTYSPRRI